MAKNYNENIGLVAYTKAQADAYIDLIGSAFVPVRKALSLKPYNWPKNNRDQSIQAYEESAKNNNLFGYYIEGKLVGVLKVEENELVMIAVHPNHQGKGYGERLLKKAIRMVFYENNYDDMILGALMGNSKAQALYMKYGFKLVANHTLLLFKSDKN